ncbi:hypothetical protein C9E85_12280 [Plesiomonas shigelloides]|uniref:hypothetical protein n=1 Tax=Plesiomonas shigelloides TaxID=703 RepID=UPI000D5681FB|nr:hypothetical protein [Plesiomonas shigelloides]PVU65622.1 hypothetical protein C9E85_12280 [Plesiomonas shigelloides]
MNEEQRSRCRTIIHTHAAAAAAGNLIPVPGAGVATDTVAMTSMCMNLCAVFGGSISEEVAKGLAIVAIRDTVLKQPLKVLAKELSKLVPFLGQVVAPSISVTMLEAAGWSLAQTLSERFQRNASLN